MSTLIERFGDRDVKLWRYAGKRGERRLFQINVDERYVQLSEEDAVRVSILVLRVVYTDKSPEALLDGLGLEVRDGEVYWR